MTGEQIQANIYMGPTYYMRLKHMVKDKINYRARGPNQQLTRQPVQGRANDGGLRIGEMERDCVCAHGMSYFLNESFLVRGDEYYMAICNKTGAIAIYNESKNLFLSPYSDGPVNFHTNPDGTMNIKNLSKFGRSFSLLRIPYSFKLLIQELQVMNIQMRVITDENVDQLLSMSYSNNINKLLHSKDHERSTEKLDKLIKDYVMKMSNIQSKSEAYIVDSYSELPIPLEEGDIQSLEKLDTDISSQGFISGEINAGSKVKIINGPFTGQIGIVNRIVGENCEIELTNLRKIVVKKSDIEMLPYEFSSSFQIEDSGSESPPYAPESQTASPQYPPGSESQVLIPNMIPEKPNMIPEKPNMIPEKPNMIPEKIITPSAAASILDVEKEYEENKDESVKQDISSSTDSGDKKVIEIPSESASDISTSIGTKKINIK
jgi:transcription antitermination factor NusG